MKIGILKIFIIISVIFLSCTTARQYDFSLKNTVSIFLLNNKKAYYFCIPVQYMGDYKIEIFEFSGGTLMLGDYELPLKKDGVNIYVYLKEGTDEFGIAGGDFNLVYAEENGKVLTSRMGEPLAVKQDDDGKLNYYYIFIEKHPANDEMQKIINEYEKGNVHSRYSIWYDITIDHEEQHGSGILDDFELYHGPATDDPARLFPNLDFFRVKYPQK